MGELRRTRLLTPALTTLLTASLLSACTAGDPLGTPPAQAGGTGTSWAPAPVDVDGLTSLASADADGFRLHTAAGDRAFLPGMNLGSTTPLHQPGELAIAAADYRRWLAGMGAMGVRAVRVYTIHPPAFYDELAAYNRAHPRAPLYLVQGVYLPDESYVEPGGTLYDAAVDHAFAQELLDASAAVHGDLQRDPAPGHASGTWRTDVSAWLAAWVVGVEWDPAGVRRTDTRFADAPYTPGRYFAATPAATATERWLAGHLDALAAAESARGVSVPLAFANWPTADPLTHPDEPSPQEDSVGVDADHVLPTRAWPGGTFANFHAYPYFPDFLRHEERLRATRVDGAPDAYAGYLAALDEHFTRMPVMVTEFGVPSSLGSAHAGTVGRDQGGHGEAEAMAIDAALLRVVREQGMAGGFVFSWTDEWFKRTWNTQAHQLPAERRQLWHDPLTNEQWFGVVATDSARVPDSARELVPEEGPLSYVLAEADASYLHLDLAVRGELPARLTVEADTVPGPETADHRIVLDLAAGTGQAWVRAGLDPVRLDATSPGDLPPDAAEEWHRYRLLTNRTLRLHGRPLPAEHQEVGALVEGDWDPAAEDYDSRATWQVLDRDGADDVVRLRVPWPMLGLADPSSRTALGEGVPAAAVPVDGLGLTFDADGATTSMTYTWPTWNHVEHTERVKDGAEVLAEAFRDAGR